METKPKLQQQSIFRASYTQTSSYCELYCTYNGYRTSGAFENPAPNLGSKTLRHSLGHTHTYFYVIER